MKLRFSRNSLTQVEKEQFEVSSVTLNWYLLSRCLSCFSLEKLEYLLKLLQEDEFYSIRLPSNVLSPPGKDYVISSVKAVSYWWTILFYFARAFHMLLLIALICDCNWYFTWVAKNIREYHTTLMWNLTPSNYDENYEYLVINMACIDSAMSIIYSVLFFSCIFFLFLHHFLLYL